MAHLGDLGEAEVHGATPGEPGIAGQWPAVGGGRAEVQRLTAHVLDLTGEVQVPGSSGLVDHRAPDLPPLVDDPAVVAVQPFQLLGAVLPGQVPDHALVVEVDVVLTVDIAGAAPEGPLVDHWPGVGEPQVPGMILRLVIGDDLSGQRAHGVEVGPRAQEPRQFGRKHVLVENHLAPVRQQTVWPLLELDVHRVTPVADLSESNSVEYASRSSGSSTSRPVRPLSWMALASSSVRRASAPDAIGGRPPASASARSR